MPASGRREGRVPEDGERARGNGNGATHGKPVIADLGLTPGHKSVVFGNYGGQLWVVKYDGTVPAGMPLTLPADVLSTPAVGDLDGDGLADIVVGYGSNFDGRPGGVRAFKNNGPAANPVFTQLWDHPSLDTTPPAGADPVFSSPAIGDLDGDGVAWVVWGSIDERIYCVKGSDGTQKAGWGPVPGNPTGGFWVGDTIYSSPALFDLDGDGKLDIIIGVDAHNQGLMPQGVRVPSPTTNGGLLLAISASGTLLPGFPIQLDQAMSSSPAVGDIDGDGKPEIVVGTGNVFTGVSHRVYAFHCDGSPVTGWPVSVDGQVVTAPALGDLDGDGIPDVVVTDDNSGPSATFHVYAFKGTGVQLWKMQPKDYFGQTLNAGDPVIADVLGDRKPRGPRPDERRDLRHRERGRPAHGQRQPPDRRRSPSTSPGRSGASRWTTSTATVSPSPSSRSRARRSRTTRTLSSTSGTPRRRASCLGRSSATTRSTAASCRERPRAFPAPP